jgi:hypothetical protein
MISAQASVGRAATPPTTGTTLITALVTRHGAAIRPQPDNIVIMTSKAIVGFFMASVNRKATMLPTGNQFQQENFVRIF